MENQAEPQQGNSGLRILAVVLIFAGLYVMIQWGILGHNPITDVQAKAKATPAKSGGITSQSPPNPGIFGTSGLTLSGYGEQYSPTVATADQQGLTAFGGGKLQHDFDFSSNNAGGQNVFLPGKSNVQYTYLGSDNSPGQWGNLIYFKAPNGGVFGLPHLVNIPQFTNGETVPGGTNIGQIGANPADYSSTYWTGPHLSVIADTKAYAWFAKIMAGL